MRDRGRRRLGRKLRGAGVEEARRRESDWDWNWAGLKVMIQ